MNRKKHIIFHGCWLNNALVFPAWSNHTIRVLFFSASFAFKHQELLNNCVFCESSGDAETRTTITNSLRRYQYFPFFPRARVAIAVRNTRRSIDQQQQQHTVARHKKDITARVCSKNLLQWWLLLLEARYGTFSLSLTNCAANAIAVDTPKPMRRGPACRLDKARRTGNVYVFNYPYDSEGVFMSFCLIIKK